MKLLVTGGAGFIGSNFICGLLRERADIKVISLDLLSYAGNLENLADVAQDSRFRFERGDIASTEDVDRCIGRGVDAVINFAAESHVDRSIMDSSAFVRTNIQGTHVLLEACRRKKAARFLQVSTDEVYGSLGTKGRFTEESPLRPNSPYSASKAAADLLVRSYHRTYGIDAIVTRCSNNYGPYQFPEKLIPLMILNALEERSLPVYGDGLHTRDWIHVEDHCRALSLILEEGRPGGIYNIGGGQEMRNLDVVRSILELTGRSEALIQFVTDRPGHDRRYAVDASCLRRELGWKPEVSFEEGLRGTVRWYRENDRWIEGVRSGAYTGYYQQMYQDRDQTLSDL